MVVRRPACGTRLAQLLRNCTLLASWVERQLAREGHSARAIGLAAAGLVVAEGRGTGVRWRLRTALERAEELRAVEAEARARRAALEAAETQGDLSKPPPPIKGRGVLRDRWDDSPRYRPAVVREINRCGCGTPIGYRAPGEPRECVWCQYRREAAS